MALPPQPAGARFVVASRPAYSILVLILVLHFTVGGYLQQTLLPFGIAYGQLLLFAGIPLLATIAMGFAPSRFLALRPLPLKRWLWIALAAFAGFVLAGGVNTLNQWLVGPEVAARFDSTRILLNRPRGELWAVGIGVALLAPIGEELLFRGYLMRILDARYGGVRALLVTSGLFALAHVDPSSILALFTLGLVFGALRLATGSIYPAIAAHAIQNGTTVAVVLLAPQELESPEPLAILPALVLIAAAAPFLFFALSRLQRGRATDGLGDSEQNLEAMAPGRPEAHDLRISRIQKPLAIWAALAVGGVVVVGALT